jgi:hypothetical protein
VRTTIATGLLLIGLFVAGLSLQTDLCGINGEDGDRYWLAVMSGSFLVGCSAFLFARRPTWSPVAPYAIAVLTIPVAIVAFAFLGALGWATSCAS